MYRINYRPEWTWPESIFIDEDEFDSHTLPSMVLMAADAYQTLTNYFSFDSKADEQYHALRNKLHTRTRATWRWLRVGVYQVARELQIELMKPCHEDKRKELSSLEKTCKQVLESLRKEGMDGHHCYNMHATPLNPERFFQEIVQLRPWNLDQYLPAQDGCDQPFPPTLKEVVDAFLPLVKILLPDRSPRLVETEMLRRWAQVVPVDRDERFVRIYNEYLKRLQAQGLKDYFPSMQDCLYKYLSPTEEAEYSKGKKEFGSIGL